jgi:hypothetical protein
MSLLKSLWIAIAKRHRFKSRDKGKIMITNSDAGSDTCRTPGSLCRGTVAATWSGKLQQSM